VTNYMVATKQLQSLITRSLRQFWHKKCNLAHKKAKQAVKDF